MREAEISKPSLADILKVENIDLLHFFREIVHLINAVQEKQTSSHIEIVFCNKVLYLFVNCKAELE